MRYFFATLAFVVAAPAQGVIVGASSHGFELRHTIDLKVPPAQALAAFGQIGSWWSKEHTYSGDAARLTMQMRPGGCWCERLEAGGGIEHMRVAYVQPGERAVLTGGLGPLLYEGTSGVMDIQARKTTAGSQLVINYRVAGFARGNGTELALAVDGVLRTQVERLRTFANRNVAR